MHQFFATFFTLLLSLCHHSAASRPLQAQMGIEGTYPTPRLSFPDRRDLPRVVSESGYADTACLSCQQMSVSFTTR